MLKTSTYSQNIPWLIFVWIKIRTYLYSLSANPLNNYWNFYGRLLVHGHYIKVFYIRYSFNMGFTMIT